MPRRRQAQPLLTRLRANLRRRLTPSSPKKSNRPKPLKSHPLLGYELKANKRDWALRLTARFLAVSLLICVIVFGASRVIIGIQTVDIFGQNVDVDLQLALFGLLNKTMDLLVTTTLEDVGAVTLTLWLAGYGAVLGVKPSSGNGLRFADFDLPQEFTKPWISISAFHRRRSFLGWRKAGIVRFVITLTTSVCVLLLGLSINTVGIPKERWYPQGSQDYMFLEIRGIDTTYWGAGWNIVGNGVEAWDAAKLYSTITTIGALKDLGSLFDSTENGWHQTGHDNDRNIVAMNTDLGGDVARAVAVQTEYAYEIFEWLKKNGTWPARVAIGWTAIVDLMVPYVATSCLSAGDHDAANISFAARQTAAVVDDGPSLSTFTVFITDGSNSEGIGNYSITTCKVSVSRALFPVDTWVSNSASSAAISVNNYGQNYNVTPRLLPMQPLDANISTSLSTQFSIVLDILDSTNLTLNSARTIRKSAERLRSLRSDVTHDEQALAAVVTMLTTTLLAYADWDMSMSVSLGNINNTTSRDQPRRLTARTIKWQVYGSGPRLAWQWTTTFILGIVLIAMLVAVVQSLVHRLSSSEVLKPAGMLVAANLSGRLRALRSGSGGGVVLEKSLEEQRFWVRSISGGNGSGTESVITDDQQQLPMTSLVVFRKKYAWFSP